ncbi:unnamed protein product [Malus baccata var. baccata]
MDDEETQEIIQARNRGKKKDFRIRETDGMLMQESRMYVPNNMELKKEILDEAHISAYAMHPGGTKMYHTIRPFYYWPGMKREIVEYVSRCVIFQQVKAERKKLFGLMQSLLVPQWKWENITMDFVYKLPRTQNGYDGIWFGNAWHKRLGLMEFAYNNSFHSSIGMSPFEALFGKSCRTPLCWLEVGERILVGPEIVDETTQNVQVIKSNLKAAQDRQKSLADRHATDRVYNVDPSHVIPPQPLNINPDLTYDEQPVTILDWKDKF